MSQDRTVTPEAVALDFQTANVGSRVIAALVDWLIIVAVAVVVTLILVASGGALDALNLPSYLPVVVFTLLSVAWVFGYFIVQETLLRGRTAGKAMMGLRVITKEGGQIRFRHAFIRGLFILIDFLATVGLAGVATIAISQRNQRLGDMVAGTIVLRERTAVAGATAVTFAPPPGLEAYTATLDTTRLGAQEYQAIRAFLTRAPGLHLGARYELALQLANPVRALVRPLPPEGLQPETFLVAVAAAYQQRQRTTGPGQVAPTPAAPAPAAPVWPAPTPDRPDAGQAWGVDHGTGEGDRQWEQRDQVQPRPHDQYQDQHDQDRQRQPAQPGPSPARNDDQGFAPPS